MSSIVYSFLWVGISRDEKKRTNSESSESTPATSTSNSVETNNTSNSRQNPTCKSTNKSYTSIDDRSAYNIDNDQVKLLLNKTTSLSSSNIDNCIGVQATKELGCTFTGRNILFQELFQSTCVRHQLCYACGFVYGITAGECNKLAYMNMYHLCSHQSLLSSKSDCLKKRFSALNLLRQHIYRSASKKHEFLIECYDECVHKYLYAD